MTDDELIEAMARAIADAFSEDPDDWEQWEPGAQDALAIARPAIRAQAFEEACDWLEARHEATLAFGLRRALANREGGR